MHTQLLYQPYSVGRTYCVTTTGGIPSCLQLTYLRRFVLLQPVKQYICGARWPTSPSVFPNCWVITIIPLAVDNRLALSGIVTTTHAAWMIADSNQAVYWLLRLLSGWQTAVWRQVQIVSHHIHHGCVLHAYHRDGSTIFSSSIVSHCTVALSLEIHTSWNMARRLATAHF